MKRNPTLLDLAKIPEQEFSPLKEAMEIILQRRPGLRDDSMVKTSPRFQEQFNKVLEYNSYCVSCTVYGFQVMTFEEYQAYLESFEYWFTRSWWNPDWEVFLDIEEYDYET